MRLSMRWSICEQENRSYETQMRARTSESNGLLWEQWACWLVWAHGRLSIWEPISDRSISFRGFCIFLQQRLMSILKIYQNIGCIDCRHKKSCSTQYNFHAEHYTVCADTSWIMQNRPCETQAPWKARQYKSSAATQKKLGAHLLLSMLALGSFMCNSDNDARMCRTHKYPVGTNTQVKKVSYIVKSGVSEIKLHGQVASCHHPLSTWPQSKDLSLEMRIAAFNMTSLPISLLSFASATFKWNSCSLTSCEFLCSYHSPSGVSRS